MPGESDEILSSSLAGMPNAHASQIASRFAWLFDNKITSIRGDSWNNATNQILATSRKHNAALGKQLRVPVSSVEESEGHCNVVSRIDLDSHASMIVIGKNAATLRET